MYESNARHHVDSRQRDLQAEAAAGRLARKVRRQRTAGGVGFAGAFRQLVTALFAAA